MRLLLKPFQWIYCIYAFALFVGIMLLIFPFVIIASFFGRIRGGNMIMRLCRFWADSWFFLVFIYFRRIYDAPHDKRKAYIFVSNHISYLDAAIIPKVYRQPVRPLGKVEMAKVPVFGFIYRKAIVTVDRSSAENRFRSVQILKSILRKGISILVFPEGTFNLTNKPLKEFYDGAFRIALETGTPIKPVLVMDAYSRMNYKSVFSLNPGRCRIVYLDEIPVDGLTLKDAGKLKEKVFVNMKDKLEKYGAGWIIGET
ncbi:MAG TPA: lysophospholipid acyltransferase family protein [Chitinophagaceae bacterium]|nr:lysophospholipid acyltransferase family protein [Chitinophagaceae bacterium]